MFRNSFFYRGIALGSAISAQDDAFRALEEGRTKAAEIARILVIKIPTIDPGQIEIHCMSYDPQFWLMPEMMPKKDTMTHRPGAKTLKTLMVH